MKRLFFSTFVILLAVPFITLAQGKVYSPLVNISKGNDVQSFEQYITFLYGMAISIAALLAVIKIVVAGAKYMLTDVFNTKSEAKSDIQGALLGLLLIMSAVIILELINPTLVKNEGITFPALQSTAQSVKVKTLSPTAGDIKRQEVINSALGGPVMTPPTSNPFVGLPGVSYTKLTTGDNYTFDSSQWNNYPNVRFEKEVEFKKRCTAAKGTNSNKGIILGCLIKKV